MLDVKLLTIAFSSMMDINDIDLIQSALRRYHYEACLSEEEHQKLLRIENIFAEVYKEKKREESNA